MEKPLEVALVTSAAFDLRDKHYSDREALGFKVGTKENPVKITANQLRMNKKFMVNTAEKIRNMLRIMHKKGHRHLVLEAFGCGVFANPPKLIAGIFKKIFLEEEFRGQFKTVYFAILKIFENDSANIEAFTSMCQKLNK